jgi:outer membrane receptor protein involved in Fe transport
MMAVPSPSRRRRVWALLPCLLLLPPSLALAQTAATAPAATAPAGDDTLVLSPFEVKSEDTGYLASTAQSGTRLRTDLQDIASSISVVTKTFMNDVGANDLGGLLVYTLGTEVNGVGGNFSDAGVVNNPNGAETDFDGMFASAAPSTRVRGLTSADLSRDFFVSGIPLDSYNVERVEISRGPNAMLFGLGSPAGIINSSLISARTNRTKTELELRTDQYGSFRSSLDHNQVLLKDQLAVRVAAVYDQQSYKVEEAWRKNARAFVAATYRPFPTTTIKVSAEIGDIDSNLPETRPPFDAYTQWFAMGRPAWNPYTGTGVLLGTPAAGWPATVFTSTGAAASTGGPAMDGTNTSNSGNLFGGQTGALGNGSKQMAIVFNDPNSSVPSLGLPGSSVIGFRHGTYDRLFQNPNGTFVASANTAQRGVRDWNYILNRVLHYNDITYGFWKNQQISDPAYFDFYNHMLHGPNKHEWTDFKAYNASIEQGLFDGKGGVELAFYREELDNGNFIGLDSTISGYTLRVDMNSHLGDGRVNPNFGRPFTTAYSKASVRNYEKDAARATLFYDLDLRDKGPKWFGRLLGTHRLTGTYTALDNSAFLSNNNYAFVSGTDYANAVFGAFNDLSNGRRAIPIIHYLGPNVSGSATPVTGAISAPVSQDLQGMTSANILFYDALPTGTTKGNWSERSFNVLTAGDKDLGDVLRRASSTREKIESMVGVMQSYWWDRTLVSTLGWRRDNVRTYDAGTVPVNPATGAADLNGFVPLPVTDETETSFNYGLVLHTPQPLRRHLPFESTISLTYNHADNFRPAGQRYDIFNNPLPGETGKTDEYGVLLSVFDGKLVFRASHYETTSGLSSSLLTSMSTPISNLVSTIDAVRTENLRGTNASNPAGVAAFNEWYNGPVGTALRNTFRFTETTLPNGQPDITSDSRSGEVVATADVVSKGEEFELTYNPTRQWRITVNANRSEAIRSRVASDLRYVVFDTVVPLVNGPAGALKQDALNDVFFFKDRFIQQVYNQMLPELANEGAPTSELREWRVNGITNYTFANGMFKGWNIGGGVRWQDKLAMGFPIITDPVFGRVPDVHNPYYGPDEINFDAWVGYTRAFKKFTFKAQLNVKNIGVGDELIPVSAQPDGSVAAWRIREPQYISLRTTFIF